MPLRWVFGVVVVVIGLLVPMIVVQAQNLPAQENALWGLDALRVEVTLAGAAQNAGVMETAVRDAVEGRLRQAGLGVRPADDRAARGDPRLLATVHTISVTGGYAFMVSVQFIERVVSLRRYVELVLSGGLPTTPTASVESLRLTAGVGWQARAMGTTSASRAPTFVREAVLEYVDRFVADYRVANPR